MAMGMADHNAKGRQTCIALGDPDQGSRGAEEVGDARASFRARRAARHSSWTAPSSRVSSCRDRVVRFGSRFAGRILVVPQLLVVGCGGSSTSPMPSTGVESAAGADGGIGPSTGGGSSGAGKTGVSDGGAVSGAAPSSGGASTGEGGAPTSTTKGPQLGAACESAGALACAGPHQKLTLVCSAGGTWQTNQTCGSGQFCSSTSGPDLGICKAADSDCADRQPGDAFCASDAVTLMQCDEDGIAATEFRQCEARCMDGKCAAALPCPDNIVYSCDPGCPGPDGSPSCFDLCPTPAGGISPLLELSRVVNGEKYAIALPAVAPNSEPCSCVESGGTLEGVAFRVPSPPTGLRWRLTYPKTWAFRVAQGSSGEVTDHYKACMRPWPSISSPTPGCATIQTDSVPPLVWFSTESPVAEPGTVFVELLAAEDARCAP